MLSAGPLVFHFYLTILLFGLFTLQKQQFMRKFHLTRNNLLDASQSFTLLLKLFLVKKNLLGINTFLYA
jgi:hypothetical protein